MPRAFVGIGWGELAVGICRLTLMTPGNKEETSWRRFCEEYMAGEERRVDVVIVGGGPIGCAAAIAHALKEQKVLVLEAHPDACERFAGEWIHPPGAQILAELAVELDAPRFGQGFAIFADDNKAEVLLPYGQGTAVCVEHSSLVRSLRRRLQEFPNVEFLIARAKKVSHGRVEAQTKDGESIVIEAKRIIGADGRTSVVRKGLGLVNQGTPLSFMAAIDLYHVELPHEGMGHVILGGPGPVLMYRVGEHVRACLDVPLAIYNSMGKKAVLRRFIPHFPKSLRPALSIALERGDIRWAKNGFSPRSDFGAGNIYLIGDALGYVHPATAAGLNNGLMDAIQVADSATVEEFAERRRSYVPELVANALYAAFARQDAEARVVRNGLMALLRGSAVERDRTMRLVAGQEQGASAFASAFIRTALRGAVSAGFEAVKGQRKKRDLIKLGAWLSWPAAALAPYRLMGKLRRSSLPTQPVRISLRPTATTATPTKAPVQKLSPNRSAAMDEDWAYCQKMLEKVSRSFSKPIKVLPHELEVGLTLGYLLCRAADTLEDHAAVPAAIRDTLFEAFVGIVEERSRIAEFQELFDRVQAPDGVDDAELELTRQLDCLMRVFYSQSPEIQRATQKWVIEMSLGMRTYAKREPGADGIVALYSMADLERYCYFVAGTVGHMITDLFREHMRDDERCPEEHVLRRHAESFGIGLQLVNMLKDVTDDRERGWSYIPRELCASVGIPLSELTLESNREKAHQVLAPMFERARELLDEALEYTLAIPADYPQLRLFCLLPLWMAIRTLALAEGNDAIFISGKPVKISRAEVAVIVAECLKSAADDTELRLRFAQLGAPVVVQ